MATEKIIFSPCRKFNEFQLANHAGIPPSKKPIPYKYIPGAISFCHKQIDDLLIPPLLELAMSGISRNKMPTYLSNKDKKIPHLGSLLCNLEAMLKIIVGNQIGLERKDIYILINKGPFTGIITRKHIKDFLFYFWNVAQKQKKVADEFLTGLKNPHIVIRMYQSHQRSDLSTDNLVMFLGGGARIDTQKEKNLALIQLHYEKCIKLAIIGNLDNEERHAALIQSYARSAVMLNRISGK